MEIISIKNTKHHLELDFFNGDLINFLVLGKKYMAECFFLLDIFSVFHDNIVSWSPSFLLSPPFLFHRLILLYPNNIMMP